MPASPSTVSHVQAKDWAKRLHKAAPALGSLTAAQAALAQMLGHASWHALDRFYANCEEVNDSAQAEADPFKETIEQANALYPGLDAKEIEVLAVELDDLDCSASELVERAQEIERESGMFTDDAYAQALEECVHPVLPPPNHRFVRVINGAGKRVLTLLPFPKSTREK